MRETIPTGVIERLPQGWGLAPKWVSRWFYAAQTALPILVALLGSVLLLVWWLGEPGAWEEKQSPPRDPVERAGEPGPLGALINWASGLPAQVRQWGGMDDVFHTARGPVILLVLLAVALILRRVAVAATHARSPERRRREREEQDRRRRRATGVTGGFVAYLECWPVVALLVAALQCAEAHRQHCTSPPGSTVARVSMRTAERIVWRAYRSRKGKARRHHERVVKAHSERVVAVLREAEVRQDAEPEQALEDLMVMLLTIAERYAEGHVGQLLDETHLGEERVAPREGLRFVAVGVSIVALLTGAALAGLPEAALVALLPLLVIGVALILNRGKVPTPGQLTDLIIPR
ncbi:hypothetical protein [Streptomyces sp. NBC_00582]|uniref:hypothetical protein n=1 Tax=Streptomyces sp. NBC_00582 TaxID=2975783 RepID=UPI002E8017E5|nr:hypothetical protein [Streptomyces sp. NBC_00582]WUB62261.1 hypothetical protein OG852_18600 [Streptomyces sp. NBC_00582]